MENKKEKTAPDVSVAADTEQPISKKTTSSISEYDGNIKCFEKMQREMQLSLDPSYLKTISMNELFDTQYGSKQPLIDGLLYPGTYIFAGSPKLGKSFLMHSLPIMSAQGHRSGIIQPEKEQCCILHWKMITAACRSVCTGCLGQRVRIIFTSLFLPVSLEKDWMNSLRDLWQSIRIRS